MTVEEVLEMVLAAGGRIVPDPDRPRLLVPTSLKPLVAEHRDGLRVLVLARQAPTARCKPAQEILHRARIFRRQIDEWGSSGRLALPVLTLPEAPDIGRGRCVSCGIMTASWRCATCLAAIYAAFDLSGSERG